MFEVQQLSKSFRYRGQATEAVKDLSFSLERGRTLGLLGPNGAGKTTVLRMLTTITAPTSGGACIAGCDLVRDARRLRAKIGYVPQSGTLMSEAIVGEELVFQGQSFGMSTRQARKRGQEALALMGAEQFMKKRAGKLSGGERRRVDIAIGIMSHPEIAFLDEPTVGLDPDARQELWELIGRIRDDWGTTVVMCTHYLDEAENLADEILLLESGRSIAHGPTNDLRDRYAIDHATITTVGNSAPANAPELDAIVGVVTEHSESLAGDTMRLDLSMRDGATILPQVLTEITAQGFSIVSIDVRKGGLGDAFFALIGKGGTK